MHVGHQKGTSVACETGDPASSHLLWPRLSTSAKIVVVGLEHSLAAAHTLTSPNMSACVLPMTDSLAALRKTCAHKMHTP